MAARLAASPSAELSVSITASNHADADGHATTMLYAPAGAGRTQLDDKRDTPRLSAVAVWRP